MGITTSDGKFFEDRFDYALDNISRGPAPPVNPPPISSPPTQPKEWPPAPLTEEVPSLTGRQYAQFEDKPSDIVREGFSDVRQGLTSKGESMATDALPIPRLFDKTRRRKDDIEFRRDIDEYKKPRRGGGLGTDS